MGREEKVLGVCAAFLGWVNWNWSPPNVLVPWRQFALVHRRYNRKCLYRTSEGLLRVAGSHGIK